jgi:tRNA threonylcarbamoyladenosine dehydratase
MLLGDEAMSQLAQARVAVVGLGGVGGFCLESLVRSGVKNLMVIDMDCISQSNFNRQPLAIQGVLGRPKTEVAADRCRSICPEVRIQEMQNFVHDDSMGALLDFGPTVVVDAIDSLNPKVALLHAGAEHGWRMISCLGAAQRFDPTQVRIGTLAQAKKDPLAARICAVLRKRRWLEQLKDLPVVYSVEPVKAKARLATPAVDASYYQRGRVRHPMGSICHVVATFGNLCAYWTIQQILAQNSSYPVAIVDQ